MRIVLVVDFASVNGGLAKVAIESAKGLARRGHRVDYFAAVGPVDPSLLDAGVTVTVLDQLDVSSTGSLMRFGLQWLWNAPALKALRALLETCDPRETIVHVHGWSKALSPSIGWVLARDGFPVVHTMHEFYLVCPNGGFYDYHAARDCGLTPMSAKCIGHNCDSRGYHRKLMRVARHAMMQKVSGLYQSARHIITISNLQREVATPYLPVGAVCYDLNNPIDAAPLGPKPADMPLGGFVYIGRLSPEKGVEIFAKAARRAGVQATFVGDGPLSDSLRAAYPEANFLGWQRPEEVRALLRAARALVFPSVWYEGQPLTVYEALAMGTPVISSDLCAGREAVVDGVTGHWFRSGDPDALATCIQSLSDDARARAMSEAAYQRYWAQPLTLDRHLDGLVDIYQKVFAHHVNTAQAPLALPHDERLPGSLERLSSAPARS